MSKAKREAPEPEAAAPIPQFLDGRDVIVSCEHCNEPVRVGAISCGPCTEKKDATETITLREAAEVINELTDIGVGDAVHMIVAFQRGDKEPIQRLKGVSTCPSCGRSFSRLKSAGETARQF